jgi:pimeloyl-ACP methyl ester carboxylesterase
MRRLARVAVLGLAGLVAALLVARAVARSRNGPAMREERAVLGGVAQAIYLAEPAAPAGAPVVLFVHGGPGDPLSPFAYLLPRLPSYNVVHWDERGAGKSYAAVARDGAPLSVDRLVGDACELADALRARFGVARVALVGHSFGSLVAALAAARRPELFSCFVGVGQVVDEVETERASLAWALEEARARGDASSERALAALGPAPFATSEAADELEKIVHSLGGNVAGHGSFVEVGLAALASPDYGLLDLVDALRGGPLSKRLLFEELRRTELGRAAPRIEVPVYFCEGRHDHIAPPEVAARWIEALDAPRGKRVCWFERSGHAVMIEEPEAFARVLAEAVAAGEMGIGR